ncbi:hypothetical protein AAVH_32739, partial [Aphelenchoides avenae]
AICPIITSLAPTCILLVLCSTEITPGQWTSLIVSAVTSITMFNPLTTIFFMRCYREQALKLLPRIYRKVHPDQRGREVTDIDGMEISRDPPGRPVLDMN